MNVCCMHGKATFIKGNLLRHDSFSQKYPGTSVQARSAFNGIFPPFKAFVFLLFAEYHLKRIFKEPTIRTSYQFPSILSGLTGGKIV